MKLLRYGPKGQERPAMLGPESELRDLAAIVPGIAGEVFTLAGAPPPARRPEHPPRHRGAARAVPAHGGSMSGPTMIIYSENS
jgi:hypothetical protein